MWFDRLTTSSCGRKISEAKERWHERRQVFDLPPVKVEVTEYRGEHVRCECGREHKAEFPEGVNGVVSYGSRIQALALYLLEYQLLPLERTQECLRDLLGIKISQGTLENIGRRAYEGLEATEAQIKRAILASPVAHGDETGISIGGKNHWLHSCSTEFYTYYGCHDKRGKEAMDEMGIWPNYRGRLISDYWKAYFRYGCEHGLCNVHHLREFKFLEEECGQHWAGEMAKLLIRMKYTVERAKAQGRDRLSEATYSRYEQHYKAILRRGYRANPYDVVYRKPGQRGKQKQTPALNMLDRLTSHQEEVLAFLYDFNVPFDNNLAERDIRMTKVKQKISGCFRSVFGAQVFCRVRSYISTLKKQNLAVFEYLMKIFAAPSKKLLLAPE